MDADDYKLLKQQTGSLNCHLLSFTKEQLEVANAMQLAQRVGNILQRQKLPLPEHHNKPEHLSSNCCHVDLPAAEIKEILAILFDMEAAASEAGLSTGSYASAVDAWHNLIS